MAWCPGLGFESCALGFGRAGTGSSQPSETLTQADLEGGQSHWFHHHTPTEHTCAQICEDVA